MLRSLHTKLVMILVLLILALMTVVGAFLLNSVEAFYLNEFYTSMATRFSDSEMVSDLRTQTEEEENGAEMLARVLSGYSGELGLDGLNRQLYIWLRQLRWHIPAFAVKKHIRVFFSNRFHDLTNGLYIDQSH